jgi:hypothetical protein
MIESRIDDRDEGDTTARRGADGEQRERSAGRFAMAVQPYAAVTCRAASAFSAAAMTSAAAAIASRADIT